MLCRPNVNTLKSRAPKKTKRVNFDQFDSTDKIINLIFKMLTFLMVQKKKKKMYI